MQHNNVPKLRVQCSFLTFNKMREKDFEILKILQNLGIKSESYHGRKQSSLSQYPYQNSAMFQPSKIKLEINEIFITLDFVWVFDDQQCAEFVQTDDHARILFRSPFLRNDLQTRLFFDEPLLYWHPSSSIALGKYSVPIS